MKGANIDNGSSDQRKGTWRKPLLRHVSNVQMQQTPPLDLGGATGLCRLYPRAKRSFDT
jgi:hypothetical protein